MKYLEFTYVDRVSGVSIFDQPAINGTSYPKISGLDFKFALESKYPTSKPLFYGTCPDTSNTSNIAGVIRVLSVSEFTTIEAKELSDRKQKAIDIANRDWESNLNERVKYNGVNFAADLLSRQLISNASQTALISKVNGLEFQTVTWDGLDDSGNVVGLELNGDQLLELHQLIVSETEGKYSTLRSLVDSINNAASLSELIAISVSDSSNP